MKKNIFPPFLQEGDTVAIVSPAGKIDKRFLAGAKKRLESWGLAVDIGKHAGSSHGMFAGTVKQRMADFQRALDDVNEKAILCSRGGYGAIHLIDRLDFTRFRESPKWLLGFSDITLLHALFQTNGYASLHSPMARHFTVEPREDESLFFLKELFFGRLPRYTCGPHRLNRTGKARGVLRGGNLAVLAGLRGTPYDIEPENSVFFLEDIGERPYQIDRMMNNLRLGGILDKLSGLIIGQFTEYGQEDKSLGKELYTILSGLTESYGYPVCYDFPVGHITRNYPLICGSEVEFIVEKGKVMLNF